MALQQESTASSVCSAPRPHVSISLLEATSCGGRDLRRTLGSGFLVAPAGLESDPPEGELLGFASYAVFLWSFPSPWATSLSPQ